MTTCQPPNCPCFCPTAASPAPILLQQGGPAAVVVVPIYGTQPFQVSILTNPQLPVTGVPLIASVQVFNGNELTITTNVPGLTETIGPYVATIQVCNACGTVTVQVQVDVVANLNPIVTDCALAQALWTPEAREPTVGDQLLAFTPAGCRALLPTDVCATLQAFPGAAPASIDTVFGQKAGECVQFTLLDVVALYDLCANLNTFSPGAPLAPGDRLIALQGVTCVTTTVADISAAVDVCALLQNLPNAVVQPTAVFYGQQAGQCFEFAVSDLIALAAPACPYLAPCDGSCAAPAYSFVSEPDGGLFAVAGSNVTLGWNNCDSFVSVGDIVRIEALNGDFIELGASINAQATVGNIGIISVAGSAAFEAPFGEARIRGSGNAFGIFDGDIGIVANSGGVSIAGNPAGGAAMSVNSVGGYTLETGTVLRLQVRPSGEWELAADPGVLGQVITSQGPGTPPLWLTATPAFPLLASDGSCAAPSYSFTSSPDSGMFYTGTSVRISDDNCTDFIDIGTSITLQTTSTLTANATNQITLASSAAGVTVTGADLVAISSTGDKVIITAANNIQITASADIQISSTLNPVLIAAVVDEVIIRGQTNIRLRTGGVTDRVTIDSGGGVSFVNGATLTITTDTGLRLSSQTSGAGANVGTLTNAPSAGNPAFWLPVLINGLARFIPAWA